MTETKRSVFDELLKMYRNSMALTHEEPVILDNDGYDIFGKIEKSYATALPDDLPVIAEVASEHIKMQKNDKRSLYQSFKSFHTSEILNQYELFDQLENSSEQYALAWVLGVWRVEETGEIVKLEAEK